MFYSNCNSNFNTVIILFGAFAEKIKWLLWWKSCDRFTRKCVTENTVLLELQRFSFTQENVSIILSLYQMQTVL